jgi:adenine-specific DNA methylase
VKLKRGSLDGVFTDPPYFDNVQYAELMDFCYVWLRPALAKESALSSFKKASTRSEFELTGNTTLGRGIEHFSQGISEVFRHFAEALKPCAPFVFTYHHNDPFAYLPLVIGILDAKLLCTATLPAVGEMSASLHIAGTDSSVLDSVFVCRKALIEEPSLFSPVPPSVTGQCTAALANDKGEMEKAGVAVTKGDLKCLLAGHIARLTITDLQAGWDSQVSVAERLKRARAHMTHITSAVNPTAIVADLFSPAAAIPTEKPRKAS